MDTQLPTLNTPSNYFLAISPVPSHPQPGARGHSLPLSLIAQVISYVEDVADIARLTRCCRLFYYMTLPVLYQKVTIRSYSELRYIDGRPAGYGSGSPFAMALSGLAAGNTAALVKDFTVTGSWSEPGAADYTRGKIPDSTILLGIALRAAIDKMTTLNSFAWSLDTKPTKPIYAGLGARSSLTSLDVRFPMNRAPRPIAVLPPIPNLRRLRVSHIDPLCYPDDISVLLLHAKKLEDIRIHWSPRMRQEAEPSIDLKHIFGKCLEANYKLPVKHFGFQNFYGPNNGDLSAIFNNDYVESTDFLEVFGGPHSRPNNIWVDDTWKNIPSPEYFQRVKNFKRFRISEIASQHAKILASVNGLEEMYFVGVDSLRRLDLEEPISPGTTPTPLASTPGYSPGRLLEHTNAALCNEYLHVFTTCHGHSLKKLLLSDQWALNSIQVTDLTSACPNLEQLGLATTEDATHSFRILGPFLKNLRAIRLLENKHLTKAMSEEPELIQLFSTGNTEPIYWKLGNTNIQWAGLGDRVLRMGRAVEVLDEYGTPELRREVTLASLDDVRDIEIWKLDCLEL